MGATTNWNTAGIGNYHNTVYLPAPSGGDDTALITSALAEAEQGSTIEWYPNARYLVTGNNGIVSTKSLVHRGNGATLYRNAAEYSTLSTSGSTMFKIANESNTSTFTSVPVIAGQQTFDVPVGEPMPSVGDLVRFRSNDTRVTSGSYLYGWETWIQGISGRTLTLAEEFPFAMGVIVLVYNTGIINTEIYNLNVDQSNQPTITPMPDHTGIYIHGRDTLVDGLTLTGSVYSTVGLRLRGSGAVARRVKAAWYYNQTGLFGGGRVGYGIEVQSNNAVVEESCEFIGCKHSVAFGADRTVVNRGATFRRNRVIEPGWMTNATDPINGFTGAVDAHSNLLGSFIVEDNDIDCVLYAANFRNGEGVFTKNRVRQVGNASIFSALYGYEMPMLKLDCTHNKFWFSSNGKVLGTPYDLTLAQAGFNISDNTIDGGSIVNTSPTTLGLDISVERNTHTNVGVYSVRINSGSNANTQVKARIRDNRIVGILATTSGAIRLEGGSTNQRASSFVNSEISGNDIDYSLTTASVYAIELTNATFSDCRIVANKVKRNPTGSTSNIRGIGIRAADTVSCTLEANETKDAWILIESSGGASSNHTDLSICNGNKFRQLQFTESAATSPLVFIGCSIQGNKARRTDNTEVIGYSPQAGSTGMASSNRFLVQSNELYCGAGATGCVNITANATGHKFEFLDNTLARPINDASATYYGTWRNVLLSGTQTWKGSTTPRVDGQLQAASAPASGTFVVGEVVWNNAPATGVTAGWICSTAPNTFKAMANLV